jgi:tetratricopeptide (TPR) repeat protein
MQRVTIPSTAGALILTSTLALGATTVNVRALPRPHLESLEPAVREQLGELRDEVDRLLGAADATDQATASALALLAETYLAYDFVEPATAALEAVRELSRRTFRVPYLLGYAYERRGMLDESVEALEDAIEVQPEDAPALVRLGKVLLSQFSLDKAPPFFYRALAADPTCVAARYGLGEASRLRGQYEAAILHYRKALEEQPSLTQAQYRSVPAPARPDRGGAANSRSCRP